MKFDNNRRSQVDETFQFVTFYVGESLFGIEAIRVQEVIRHQDMTPIPLAPQAIQGLINLRGQIVTAVDALFTLGLASGSNCKTPMDIIIATEDGAMSLLVDQIGDVLEVPASSYSAVPDNMPLSQRDMIAGVYKLCDKLMLLLNFETLIENACH